MPFIYAAIAWFVGSTARRILWNTTLYFAYVTLVLASAAAMFTAFKALLQSIYVAVPQIVIDIWHWALPDNTLACLFAVMTAYFLRAVYDLRVTFLDNYIKINRSS